MRNCSFIIFIAGIFFIFACSDDETADFSSGFDAPVVYGYFITDIDGNYLGTVGSPNIRNDDPEKRILNSNGLDNITRFRVSPNPVESLLIVRINAEEGSTKEIYIVPARNSLTNINPFYNYFNMILLPNNGLPLAEFKFKSMEEKTLISINCSEFNEGFYRIYVKIGDILLYDNILICRTQF